LLVTRHAYLLQPYPLENGTGVCMKYADVCEDDRSSTFHDIDKIAHITFLNNQTSVCMLECVHTIDNRHNLIHFKIFHEIIV
jgi:hypothetical protein